MPAPASPNSANDSSTAPPPMQVLRGLAVSPGIAIGPVLVLDPRGMRLPPRKIAAEAVAAELARLDQGLDAAWREAEQAGRMPGSRLGPQYADILAAHARMIGDPTFATDTHARIEQERIAAEHAVIEVLEAHAMRLERLSDSHLAARAADVRDIEARILGQLIGQRPKSFQDELAAPALVLAQDLSPSEAAGLDPQRVLGFATEGGGRASHTAIVAAALEIPAVVGLGRFLDLARQSRMAIIDGDQGLVILDPDEPTQARYRTAAAERSARFQVLSQQADLPAETLDSTRVELWGNIEFTGEVEACLRRGAVGVGLFRTEFLFLNADASPTEDQQFEAYAAVIRSLRGASDRHPDPRPGRRQAGSVPRPRLRRGQSGPRPAQPAALAPRSGIVPPPAPGDSPCQHAGRCPDSLSPGVHPRRAPPGPRRARDVAAELMAEGHSVRENLPVGIMVEVPAAALMADHLAKEVDFFSIGTNDLIQYTLAVDRTNETVAELYSAADPSVLRLIAMVVEAARANGIEVTVCGAMGGEPIYTMLLLGLGLRQLSMPPHQLPEIRRVIRSIRIETARAVAAEAVRLETAQAVTALLENALRQAVSDMPAQATTSATALMSLDASRNPGDGRF